MNNILDVKLHNRFDIEVTDSKTGKLKQRATAYNIILDTIWDRLCKRSTYCTHIHVGDGSDPGGPQADRNKLFGFLGAKAITTDLKNLAYPVTTWRVKCVLNPEDHVGKNLSEVGIAYGATETYLVTHAMLVDSEDKPIVINKTSTDVVTIYATVYITVSLDESYQSIINPPSNIVLAYLTGAAWSGSTTCYLGKLPRYNVIAPSHTFSKTNTNKSMPITYDVSTKKINFSEIRFGISEGNMDIREVSFAGFNFTVPTNDYSGTTYTDVPLGPYDGTNRIKLPSTNIRSGSISGNFTFDTFKVKLPLAASINYEASKTGLRGLSVSPDGKYFTLFYNNELKLYKYNNRNFIQVDAATTVTDPTDPIFSNDSKYVILATASAPYLYLYEIINDKLIAIEIDEKPTVAINSAVLANSGALLALTSTSSPYLYVYSFNSGLLTKLSTTTPGSSCYTATFNDASSLLAVSSGSTPYLALYSIAETTLTKLSPTDTPSRRSTGLAFNPSGTLLAATLYSYSPYLELFSIDNNDLAREFSDFTTTTVSLPAIFCSDTTLIMGCSASPFIRIYDIENDALVLRDLQQPHAGGAFMTLNTSKTCLAMILNDSTRTNPSLYLFDLVNNLTRAADTNIEYNSGLIGPAQPVSGVKFHPQNDEVLACTRASYSNGQLYFFPLSTYDTYVTIKEPYPALDTDLKVTYTVDGIHKTDQYVLDIEGYIQFGEYEPPEEEEEE